MSRNWRVGLGLCTAAAIINAAGAETPKPNPKESSKETVTVAAQRPSVQVLPDRTVYSLEKNIQSSSSSLSDVLRNLPSVDVDIQGNVALRGDSNVTILVDGKKSPLLAGNRADALQQIPASMVERIEVITNPSAEFRAEGSGGIINIILKKDKELVSSGIVRVMAGSEGRAKASFQGNLKLGRVRLYAGYGEQRESQRYRASTERTNGTAVSLSQQAGGKSTYSGRYAFLSGMTDITAQDQINLGGNYNGFIGHYSSLEHNISSISDLTRNGYSRWSREGTGGQFSYRHKFATKDEEFSLDATRFQSWWSNANDYTTLVTATGEGNYWQSRNTKSRDAHTELKASYVLPLPEQGKFKAGYVLNNDSNQSDGHGLWRDPTLSDWAVDTGFTNFFLLDRTTHAGYVSYEQKFGRFGVMGGLRVEQDFLTTNLKTTGEVHDTDSLGFFPNLHLSYALTDTQQLRLSYSRRINRPGTNLLNPTRYSSDAYNVWAGNPLLKPEYADSYETSYHYTGDKTDVVVTGFYRANYHSFTSVYRYLSSSVLLTTMDNLAHRMASGLETNVNITLLPSLSLKGSSMLAYSEFNPGAQGIGKKQSGMNWNIKGGLDWQVTPDDMVQFNAKYSGKQRFSQGYTNPSLSGDLGYRHRFEGGFAGVLTINNLFDSWDNTSVLDSPGLHQVSYSTKPGQVYYLGLVYTFGGAKDTERQSSEGNEQTVPGSGP